MNGISDKFSFTGKLCLPFTSMLFQNSGLVVCLLDFLFGFCLIFFFFFNERFCILEIERADFFLENFFSGDGEES